MNNFDMYIVHTYVYIYEYININAVMYESVDFSWGITENDMLETFK